MKSQSKNQPDFNQFQSNHQLIANENQQKLQPEEKIEIPLSQWKQPHASDDAKSLLNENQQFHQHQQKKPNQQCPIDKQSAQESQQKRDIKKQSQLQKKRYFLLKQLQKVKIELNEIKQRQKHNNQNRTRARVRTSLSIEKQEEYFIKADNLIRRIKQQREERVMNRKKSLQKKNNNVQKNNNCDNTNSIQLTHDEQSLKEEKRQFILKRIQERKHFAQMRKQTNKRSNSLIKLLIDKGTKHDNHSISDQAHNQTSKTEQTQHTSQKQSSIKRKKYLPGHFLVQLLREEERLKSEQKLKTIERRRVILKHKQYSQKIRSRTRVTCTYLTEIDKN